MCGARRELMARSKMGSMSRTPRQVVELWVAAFNACDAEAAAAVYAIDAVNTQFAAGPPVVGREQILAGLREFFIAFPDITTTPVGLYSDGDWSILEWIGTGTWKGPFLNQVPTGRSYTLRGCGFFRVKHGLIQDQRGYWDRATWFGQIGLPIEQR
jgi:steroid delta-isomerase-like uncharacterized protein